MDSSGFDPGYDTCTEVNALCPVEATLYGDYFHKGPVVFFTVAFGLLLLYQIWAFFKSLAWGFSIWLALGTGFELVGYACRIAMVDNPWNSEAFERQLLLLILGPTFIAAALAVTFKHIVLYYGPELSVLRPRWYPFVFVGTDVIAIFVQGAGAILAGQGESHMDLSTGLLIGGVSFQLVNMIGCGLLMVLYWKRYQSWKREATKLAARKAAFKAVCSQNLEYGRARVFVWALAGAYVLIIIRCIYRVPEMALGWGSSLMQNETLFLILDGAMILLSVLVICVFHPARFFLRLGKGKHKDGPIPAHVVRRRQADNVTGDSYNLEEQ